jgi:hypothetical protein
MCPVLCSYRIRPPTDKESSARVSKPVQDLRDFEGGLLTAYQRFVRYLERVIIGAFPHSPLLPAHRPSC